ncbi:uncharacterized protein LOC113512844 [Galleria mellonella]|uniref:Uncharacterized protein LOC113512844 n=1 Tax=Galleria mellonella TaxID=7137 RepID=A0A6J1WMY1_GALME|nr:uncharacterized protein LOC113512844 [Galleria mellonella]
MMRIVYFLAILGVTCAATFRGHLPAKPQELADKEGCYIHQISDVIPFGSQLTPIGECIRIQCGKHMIHYATCGVVGTTDPECYVTDTDVSRPYPDCCPTVKCDLDNNLI